MKTTIPILSLKLVATLYLVTQTLVAQTTFPAMGVGDRSELLSSEELRFLPRRHPLRIIDELNRRSTVRFSDTSTEPRQQAGPDLFTPKSKPRRLESGFHDLVPLENPPDSFVVDWDVLYAPNKIASHDVLLALTIDRFGNIYTTGQSDSTLTFVDIITTKYDPSGLPLWKRRYTSSVANADVPTGIAVDSGGNVYVAGFSFNFTTDYDFVTIKYSTDGDEEWVAHYDGPVNDRDIPTAITVDSIGNAYVGGGSTSDQGFYDYTTIAYTPDGFERWIQRYNDYGGEQSGIFALTLDQAGDLVVTGMSADIQGTGDVLTIKYDTSGTQEWLAVYDGPNQYRDVAYDLAVDGDNNILLTGFSTQHLNGVRDMLTLKYSPTGTELWAAYFDAVGQSDVAYAIDVDDSGNTYIGGYSNNSISRFDMLTVKYDANGIEQWSRRETPSVLSGLNDLVVDTDQNVIVTGAASFGVTIKYSPSGSKIWESRFDIPEAVDEYPDLIAVDRNGNIIVAGALNISPSWYDFLVIKYSPVGNQLWYRTYNGVGRSSLIVRAMRLDYHGNAYIAADIGITNDSALYTYQTHAGLILKYSAEGVLIWVRKYDGVILQDLVVGDDGGLYFIGTVGGIVTNQEPRSTLLVVKYNVDGTYYWSRTKSHPTAWLAARKIKLDGAGHFYTATRSTVPLDLSSFLLTKWTIDGDEVWSKTFPFNDPADLGIASPERIITTGNTQSGSVTASVDADGNVSWSTPHPGTSKQIEIDGTGGIYIRCWDPHSLQKLDTAGNLMWNRAVSVNPRDIAVNSSGQIVMVGSNETGFSAGYDASGNQTWLNVSTNKYAHAGSIDECGNSFIIGWEDGFLTLDAIGPSGADLGRMAPFQPNNTSPDGKFLKIDRWGSLYMGGRIQIGTGGMMGIYLRKVSRQSTFTIDTDSLVLDDIPLTCSAKDTVFFQTSVCTANDVFIVSAGDSLFTLTPRDPTTSFGTSNAFIVTFTPTSPGQRSASFTVTHAVTGTSRTLHVAGTGVENYLEFGPDFVHVDTTTVGCARMLPVTITNLRCDTVHLHASMTEPDFFLNVSEFVLAPQSSETVWVSFYPLSGGAVTGDLILSMTESPVLSVLGLSGEGIGTGGEVNTTDTMALGWHLISNPVLSVCPAVFPKAYRFDGSYQQDDTLQPGLGYWWKLVYPRIAFAGEAITALDQSIDGGWNIVGSISEPIPVSSLSTSPPGILLTPFYAYAASGYEETDTIHPGHGYWVKTSQSGELLMQSGLAPVTAEITTRRPVPENSIRITDNRGQSRVLYLARSLEDHSIERYELPPLPPGGTFDVRFASGRNLELINAATPPVIQFSLSGAEYPVTIRWQFQDPFPIFVSTGGNEVLMQHSGSIEVLNDATPVELRLQRQQVIPREFSLAQNYPNPFNPVTTIRYALPEAAPVRLSVHSLLGEQIAIIVDEAQPAGYHEIAFHGEGLSSGVYLYRLEAGTFRDVKKLLLLR